MTDLNTEQKKWITLGIDGLFPTDVEHGITYEDAIAFLTMDAINHVLFQDWSAAELSDEIEAQYELRGVY